ncbi:hypothetical protein ACQ86G_19160 [Roseateles chitinivorans]|uniref:hypothetical protein n=1 Tax=Roseateles chitinivorans TaxID=2917965 RepID=UPI003D6747A4
MKRILVRLLVSSVIALAAWMGVTALLMAWWLPPVPPGTDDLGAGLLAVTIAVATLQVALIALAVFNVFAGLRDRRLARQEGLRR